MSDESPLRKLQEGVSREASRRQEALGAFQTLWKQVRAPIFLTAAVLRRFCFFWVVGSLISFLHRGGNGQPSLLLRLSLMFYRP